MCLQTSSTFKNLFNNKFEDLLRKLCLPGFLGAVAVVETFADFAVSVAVQCVVGALETVAFRHCSSMRPLLQFQWQLARYCGVTIAAVAAVGYYGQPIVTKRMMKSSQMYNWYVKLNTFRQNSRKGVKSIAKNETREN